MGKHVLFSSIMWIYMYNNYKNNLTTKIEKKIKYLRFTYYIIPDFNNNTICLELFSKNNNYFLSSNFNYNTKRYSDDGNQINP